MVHPVHVGKERDPSGTEDDRHDLWNTIILVICNISSAMSYSDANKLLVQNDPGEKVDKRGICSEKGGDHRAVKDPELWKLSWSIAFNLYLRDAM